jgi:hypothetical protein
MPVFKDIVQIKDKPWDRAVKVTITARDVSMFEQNSHEVIALAQKAWTSPNHTFNIGGMTVKVEIFGI